ncbi:MAG: LysR family transcriptional regulator [Pseudohongiellaceae bacterium]
MNTKDLRVFIAAAETGSFSEAAELIHLSQPAVSKRIANLETQLDARLFDRISRQVFLTEAGRIFLPRARSILQDLETTRQALHSLRGETSGKLSIAISHHLGLHRLPPILKTYAETYPNVDLDVAFSDSEKAYEGVLHGSVEVAVNTLALTPVPRIQEILLWSDQMHFVCTHEHPLAKLKRPTLRDLSEYRCLIPDTTTFTGRLLLEAFNREGLSLKPLMSTNFLQTLGKMTEIGLGWSMLPETLIDTDKLYQIPIELPLQRQLGIIHHAERTLSSAAMAFIEICRKETIANAS